MAGQLPVRVAAVDLGASSGRVVAAELVEDVLSVTEVHRFPNGPVRADDTLRWDIKGIYAGVLEGLRKAGPVSSIGVDSWAVDYGLLDQTGALIEDPVHYRDARTDGVPEAVHRRASVTELYATTGVQVQPFNTIYQLVAAGTPALETVEQLLLIPDLIGYWLTGIRVAEVTNTSTTGLLDVRSRSWSGEVMGRLRIPLIIFPPLVEPGEVIGRLTPAVAIESGQTAMTQLTAVGSHDTASAVAAVPADVTNFGFIATGTWSLVGVELATPVLSEESRAANFTNELGVDGTVRYLRNVMGLWLLQECLRDWGDPDLGPLLEAARSELPLQCIVDAGSAEFLAPGDMPARLAAACVRTGQLFPTTRAATVRCILDSLALAHRRAIRQATALSGRPVGVVHLVGGGAHNTLLCQLTADACGLPVIAGPAEAAAFGNALVQLRTLGAIRGELSDLRRWLRSRVDVTRYEPEGPQVGWDTAERMVSSAG
jgi:rhamnulokinase